jgi:hypothetical protein
MKGLRAIGLLALATASVLAMACDAESESFPTPTLVPTSSAVSVNSREFIMNERWREVAEAACSRGYSQGVYDATRGCQEWRRLDLQGNRVRA